MTIDAKRTVITWWIFSRMDETPHAMPEDIRRWLDEAEDDLAGCNERLANKYSEYMPQNVK